MRSLSQMPAAASSKVDVSHRTLCKMRPRSMFNRIEQLAHVDRLSFSSQKLGMNGTRRVKRQLRSTSSEETIEVLHRSDTFNNDPNQLLPFHFFLFPSSFHTKKAPTGTALPQSAYTLHALKCLPAQYRFSIVFFLLLRLVVLLLPMPVCF